MKKKIIISKRNIRQIFDCPAVCGIEKLSKAEGWGRDFFAVYVRGVETPLSEHSILVQDDDGHWFCMPKEDYKAFTEQIKSGEFESTYPTCSAFYARRTKKDEPQSTTEGGQENGNKTEPGKMDKAHQSENRRGFRPLEFQRLLKKAQDFWHRHNQCL